MFRSGYRLCWCSCLALVLLRVGVGWHFLYEGLTKIESHRTGVKPFSAEGYLANSSGPLRDWFRAQLDDPDGLSRLEPASITERWQATLLELDNRYRLDDEQMASARGKLQELETAQNDYFRKPEILKNIEEYRRALAQRAGELAPGSVRVFAELEGERSIELNVIDISETGVRVQEAADLPHDAPLRLWVLLPDGRQVHVTATPASRTSGQDSGGLAYSFSTSSEHLGGGLRFGERSELAYERERAQETRRGLAKTRDELVGPIDAWTASLRQHVLSQLKPEQRKAGDRITGLARKLNLPFKLSWPERRIDQINLVTMCGLTLAGGLLIVGLFSRLSALAAAGFVAMFYLCQPAPPLGVGNPADPGHYLYVNKELIECLAALVLATIPTGRWLGLDALIGWPRRFIQARSGGAAYGSIQ